jgi:predicted nucleic acid-binding protein
MDFEEKTRVYLDTSVISHLDHPDAGEQYAATHEFWEMAKAGKYSIYLSELVFFEVDKCKPEKRRLLRSLLLEIPYTNLTISAKTLTLAQEIIHMGFLPPHSIEDSQHIAAALYANCDYLLSWNMKHLSNNRTNKGIRELVIKKGFDPIFVMSPKLLLEMGV